MRAVLEEMALLIRPFDCGKILAWPESVCHSAVVGKARFSVLCPPCPAEVEGASVFPLAPLASTEVTAMDNRGRQPFV